MGRYFVGFLAASFLSGCVSTVDYTIPLSQSFESNSKLITVNLPKLSVSDSAFDIEIENYAIKNTYTSWKKFEDRKLTNIEHETNYLNYILFDDELSFIKKEFELESKQSFNFELTQNNNITATSHCEIYAQSLSNEHKSYNLNASGVRESSESIASRNKTFLVCSIKHLGQIWKLTLLSENGNGIKAQFASDALKYDIKSINDSISLIKTGDKIEKHQSAPWLSNKSGLSFSFDNTQASAISFVGKPRFWLSNTLTTEQKQLLIAVNYSLTLFNRIDGDWREKESFNNHNYNNQMQ